MNAPTLPPIKMPGVDKDAQHKAAFAEIERGMWERNHPHIPFDVTLEEANRGTVVNGRWQMAAEDVARRIGRAA